jgi:putative flippase GtrA
LIRFLAVGGLNTLFGYCLFAFLIWVGLSPQVALILGTIIGPMFNFVTYGKLAFGQALSHRNLPRFIAVYVIFYLINAGQLHVFVDRLHFSAYITQLIATPILSLGMFFSLRFFVFRQRG